MDIRNFFGGGGAKKPNGSSKVKDVKKKPAATGKDTAMTKKKDASSHKKTPPKETKREPKVTKADTKKKAEQKVPPPKETKKKVPKVIKVDTKEKAEQPVQKRNIKMDPDVAIQSTKSGNRNKSTTPTKSDLTEESKSPSSVAKRKAKDSEEGGTKKEESIQSKSEPVPSPSKKRKTATPQQNSTPKPACPKPTESISAYEPSPGTFNGLTFVFTGVIEDLNRDDGIDYVKIYGGRVTTAVSGKTNYLVVGTVLEDGREIEEGSKYKKAKSLGDKVHILKGSGELFALAKMLDTKKENGSPVVKEEPATNGNGATSTKISNPYAKPSSVVNPYAKSPGSTAIKNPYAKTAGGTTINNPYAKKPAMANPYAKPAVTNPYAKKANVETLPDEVKPDVSDPSALWADKYAPKNTRMILGNKESVSKLAVWLEKWEDTFNRPTGGKKRSFNPKTGPFKAALLSGPPGIGKTTTATLVAAESGRQVLELNASDARSKKMLESSLADVTGCQVLSFKAPSKKERQQKRVIIMDEVDGMGAGDRGGMAELISMIKQSKVPIICICNDRQNPKVKSLVNHCMDLKYRRPTKSVIARRAVQVGQTEGMTIEPNAAEALAESCGNDIRQVLNCLQMWGNKKQADKRVDMTYKAFKDRDNLINKDEMLRVTMFDAAKMICEGRKGLTDADDKTQLNSLYKRTDAFFTDYALMGLLVHQNYLKVGIRNFQQVKAKGDNEAEYESLLSMYKGTEAMSDFAVAEHGVRSGNQNWGLLPLCSVMTVKSAYHIGGDQGGMLPGFPEFSGWLGKNSSRGKRDRLLQELGHHMNYKISADKTEIRLAYLPVIRDRLSHLLITNDPGGPKVKDAIEFMDEYGLDRDDVFENLEEFCMDQNAKKFADIDSKAKASFTREYNKGVHKSQALIEEQGLPTRKRKKAATEDEEIEDEASDDEEMTEEDIKKLFKRGSKGGGAGKTKGKTKKSKKK